VVVAATPPGTPRNPAVTITGTTVRFGWEAPASGSTPTGYLIEAGLAAGRTDIGPMPWSSTTFEATNVPTGRYYLRVRAVAGATSGAATSDLVADVVPDLSPPGVPTGLASTVTGRSVNLRWSAPVGGAAVAAYVLEVGSTSGATDLVPGLVVAAQPATFTAGEVPPGDYFVRVRARSAAGVVGPPSADVLVSVAGSR
jgi:predicted phage tail protein